MRQAPKYEEFRDSIWNSVTREGGRGWDLEDLKRYLKSEEELIVDAYEEALKDYEAGTITHRQFTEGIPASIAYNLEMSY